MTGTSQAAAVTSGIAALIIQQHPGITPDEVKCKLMASAKAATRADGSLAYSVFQQGSGLVNAFDAVHGDAGVCKDTKLSLSQEMRNEMHFGGPANLNGNGVYGLTDASDFDWDSNQVAGEGFSWKQTGISGESFIWDVEFVWNLPELAQNNFIWNRDDFESNTYTWDFSTLVQQEAIANFNGVEHHGLIWDLVKNGCLWKCPSVDDETFVWDATIIENETFLWDLALLENYTSLWDLANLENSTFLWDLANVENYTFLWELANVENSTFLWDLAMVENSTFLWDLASVENSTFLWDLASVGNESFVWNMSQANKWVGQE
jgi:hypothetical protein